MKIAFLGPAPPIRGGISAFAVELAKCYLEMGHQVKMFGFRKQYPALIFPGKSQTASFDLPQSLQIDNCFIPYRPDTWPKGLKAIRELEPDILFISYFIPFFAPLYFFVARAMKKAKVCVILHNLVPHERWPAARLLAKSVLKHADSIVCLSEATKTELKRLMPNEIYLKSKLGFHPVYNQYQIQEEIAREPHTLLFFGLIKKYKGLDILISAMPKVLEQYGDAKLLIVGEVYGSDELYQNLIDELGIQENVESHFRYVEDNEVAGFFQRSSLCVLPYRTASQSGVIAMAMALGVPVLASAFEGLAQYIEDGVNGLLVPADPEPSPDDLADKIIEFFDTQAFESMSQAQKDKAKEYTWEALAQMLL